MKAKYCEKHDMTYHSQCAYCTPDIVATFNYNEDTLHHETLEWNLNQVIRFANIALKIANS